MDKRKVISVITDLQSATLKETSHSFSQPDMQTDDQTVWSASASTKDAERERETIGLVILLVIVAMFAN